MVRLRIASRFVPSASFACHCSRGRAKRNGHLPDNSLLSQRWWDTLEMALGADGDHSGTLWDNLGTAHPDFGSNDYRTRLRSPLGSVLSGQTYYSYLPTR